MPEDPVIVPPPVLLSILTCERVIIDAHTGNSSLINLISVINATRYPAAQPQLSVYYELTNGRGDVDMRLDLVDINENEKTLLSINHNLQFSAVHEIKAHFIGLNGFPFPHPGEYRFELHANNEWRGARRVICNVMNTPGGAGTDGQNPTDS